MSEGYDDVTSHVVFVHGLGGDLLRTWTSRGPPPVFWPTWLEEDLERTGVWTLGYDAPKTNWRGAALPVPDRANDVLDRLLAEPRILTGSIAFVGHSLGGIIIKATLLAAHRDRESDRRKADLLARSRKVAFLGTPHRGSLLASLGDAGRVVFRPSSATEDLKLEGANLRDLNTRYKQLASDCRIQHLVMIEGWPEQIAGLRLPNWFGRVVQPSSADPGLPVTPKVMDADHRTISKPKSKIDPIYTEVRDFLASPPDSQPGVTRPEESANRQASELKRIAETLERVTLSAPGAANPGVIDQEALRRVERLRKSRLFGEFNTPDETRNLTNAILKGELSAASSPVKSEVLAWCSRLLSGLSIDEAEAAYAAIPDKQSPAAVIADCFLDATRGDVPAALGKLDGLGSPEARSAAFVIVQRTQGVEAALSWLDAAGLTIRDLDPDGKVFLVNSYLQQGEWDAALSAADSLTDADFDAAPALILVSANANLAQAVGEQLRQNALEYLLIDVHFPLSLEARALHHRRAAQQLFSKMSATGAQLGLPNVAAMANDKSLWLRLRDPANDSSAREELAASMLEPTIFLRRLYMAFGFGLPIDPVDAEERVNRATTLSGGKSYDAAIARLALVFRIQDIRERVAYLQKHRKQLSDAIGEQTVATTEIEFLAGADRVDEAQAALDALLRTSRPPENEVSNRLERLIEEARGSNPIATRLSLYEASGEITDLRNLVLAYEESENWPKVIEYGQALFKLTGDVTDARRLAHALYEQRDFDGIFKLLSDYPALLDQSSNLRFLQCQCLYEAGRLNDAREKLLLLRGEGEVKATWSLFVNVAIASGDWESIAPLIEEEWNGRDDREAAQLLRVGYLAQRIGSPRGKELIRTAVAKANSNAQILVSAYSAAAEAGWENSEEVGSWLQVAAHNSTADGPIQTMSLQDLVDFRPGWDKRQRNAWDLLSKGDIPIFTAAHTIGRTLLSLFLVRALSNLNEDDVRKRAFVFAYSGTRGKHDVVPKTAAMEGTSLLTAEFVGILSKTLDLFDRVFIPHETMPWLLEEKSKVQFHQPSRVQQAEALGKLLADKHLFEMAPTVPVSAKLIEEVGESLAEMLASANEVSRGEEPQRVVVRGGPIHRASSLMTEIAEIGAYEHVLCSCTDVVERLAQLGTISSAQAKSARAALEVREEQWPNAPAICPGAHLYLDDLAVSHFEFLGLLDKLHRAGFVAFISRTEVREASDLISYSKVAGEVVATVEQVRAKIAEGIRSGKVVLGTLAAGESDNDDLNAFNTNPTMGTLRLVDVADVAIIDDRFVNQHKAIASPAASRALLTTLDLLDGLLGAGRMTIAEWDEARLKLRNGGYGLIPVEQNELARLVRTAPVVNGKLAETAELKAIRNSVLRIRMSDILQLPKEHEWLNGLVGAVLLTIKDEWVGQIDPNIAAARSDWLLELGDVRGWTHRVVEDAENLRRRYVNYVRLLMMLPMSLGGGRREEFWAWIESRILRHMKEEDPTSFSDLVEASRGFVEEGADRAPENLEVEDEE